MREAEFFSKNYTKAIIEVHDACDNVEFEAVRLEFVAIAIRQDFGGFELRENMFDLDSQP
jgi:hypothetical protein